MLPGSDILGDQTNRGLKWINCRIIYAQVSRTEVIYSRHVVGWMIADRECQHLAKQLIQKTTLKHGIPAGQLTLHSDNGPSMTSHTVSQLLERIGVLKTHNRPYTSNDNPFSESQFKTMKYCPEFPNRFESIADAEEFPSDFLTGITTHTIIQG